MCPREKEKMFELSLNRAFLNKYCYQYCIYQYPFYMASFGIFCFLLLVTVLTLTGKSWSCHICRDERYKNADLKMCTMLCKNLLNSVLILLDHLFLMFLSSHSLWFLKTLLKETSEKKYRFFELKNEMLVLPSFWGTYGSIFLDLKGIHEWGSPQGYKEMSLLVCLFLHRDSAYLCGIKKTE